MFEKLKKSDIEEKVQLNLKNGSTIEILLWQLKDELFDHERYALRIKFDYSKKRFYRHKTYLKVLLPIEIQAQNLREQIDYINEKIAKEKTNGS